MPMEDDTLRKHETLHVALQYHSINLRHKETDKNIKQGKKNIGGTESNINRNRR